MGKLDVAQANRQKIAIVGSGIAGLTSAYMLYKDHEITLFEADEYIGGHTHTVEVEIDDKQYAIDTGFIVFNDTNYPHFSEILRDLGVASEPTDMSFSMSCGDSGLEYSSRSLNSLFAQRRNILRPSFHRMIRDIRRFFQQAAKVLQDIDCSATLGEYLEEQGYSDEFIQHHIIPMGAALWSAPPERVYDFPVQYFIKFFDNHRFLQVQGRTPWRVISGGSHQYVKQMVRPFHNRIRLNTAVQSIQRKADNVILYLQNGQMESFDAVVLALHSDQALKLLQDPSIQEEQILGSMGYHANQVVLHTDTHLLPRRRRAWAAWNYNLHRDRNDEAVLTYNMNMLQNLEAPQTFCVSLNANDIINPKKILRTMTYYHPQYTLNSVAAQNRHAEINGVRRTFYCGAYWGYGFHEDGVKSGLLVARAFGV